MSDSLDDLANDPTGQPIASSYVAGPTTSTDNSIPRYNGDTGKVIQGSGVTVADNNYVYTPASIESAGAIIVDTVAEHTAASGVTIDGLLIKDSAIPSFVFSYVLQGGAAASTPGDSLTYYIGNTQGNAPSSTQGNAKIYIPRTGTIKKCYLHFFNATSSGTTETSSAYIRLNNTTDTTLSTTIAHNVAMTDVNVTDLSIAVAADDYVEIKWVTPAWVTNPAGTRISVILHIEC